MKAKVATIEFRQIVFDNGWSLYSEHEQDCCESHSLDFKSLELSEFDGLVFDLNSKSLYNKVPDFGIELIPIAGHPVRIAGHSSNNGYYSSNLHICLKDDKSTVIFLDDISECQFKK